MQHTVSYKNSCSPLPVELRTIFLELRMAFQSDGTPRKPWSVRYTLLIGAFWPIFASLLNLFPPNELIRLEEPI